MQGSNPPSTPGVSTPPWAISDTTGLQAALDAKLALAGGTMSGALLIAAGLVGTPGLTFSGDLNTGIWSSGADVLDITTNGVNRIRVIGGSTGYVAIGPITSPAQLLHLRQPGGSGAVKLRLEEGSATHNVDLTVTTGGNFEVTIDGTNQPLSINVTAQDDALVIPAGANSIQLATALDEPYGGTGQAGGYTKGDILVATGASTLAKVGVGADGEVLTAASGEAAGVEWAAPAGIVAHCELTNSGAQAIGSGAVTALSFDTEVADASGMHAGGSPTRITIPAGKGGNYAISGSATFAGSAAGTVRYPVIRRNGTPVLASQALAAGTVGLGGGNVEMAISTLALLADGDYLEFCVYQDTGGNLNISAHGDNTPCRFVVTRQPT